MNFHQVGPVALMPTASQHRDASPSVKPLRKEKAKQAEQCEFVQRNDAQSASSRCGHTSTLLTAIHTSGLEHSAQARPPNFH